jgi:nitrilase
MMSITFKAAVVQMASVPGDAMATAGLAAERLREAAGLGARLVVFPEALIGGYPKGASFGAPIGMRKPEGREAFARYHAGAIDLSGPEVELLCEAAADTGAFARRSTSTAPTVSSASIAS